MFRFSPTKQLLARTWIFLSIDSLTGSFCKVFVPGTTSLELGGSMTGAEY